MSLKATIVIFVLSLALAMGIAFNSHLLQNVLSPLCSAVWGP